MSAVLFYALRADGAAASALGVVISRNIVRMAVCLLFTLVGVAGLYFLLNAEFLAAVQLVVYAGGTLILIIFGVMLTSKIAVQPVRAEAGGSDDRAVASARSCCSRWCWRIRADDVRERNADRHGRRYPIDKLGQALLGDYLVPFELVERAAAGRDDRRRVPGEGRASSEDRRRARRRGCGSVRESGREQGSCDAGYRARRMSALARAA